MTAKKYGKLASKLGTRAEVAAALGVDISTVFRRISRAIPITKEAALALASLGCGGGVSSAKPSREQEADSKKEAAYRKARAEWEAAAGDDEVGRTMWIMVAALNDWKAGRRSSATERRPATGDTGAPIGGKP